MYATNSSSNSFRVLISLTAAIRISSFESLLQFCQELLTLTAVERSNKINDGIASFKTSPAFSVEQLWEEVKY